MRGAHDDEQQGARPDARREARDVGRAPREGAGIHEFFLIIIIIYYLKWLAHRHYTHMYRLLATMLLDSYIG